MYGDGLADDLLRAAIAIHLRRVDQAVAHAQGGAHGGHLGRTARRVLAQAPGAQAEHGHRRSRRQVDGLHSVHALDDASCADSCGARVDAGADGWSVARPPRRRLAGAKSGA
jgi:hypothetical protein